MLGEMSAVQKRFNKQIVAVITSTPLHFYTSIVFFSFLQVCNAPLQCMAIEIVICAKER